MSNQQIVVASDKCLCGCNQPLEKQHLKLQTGQTYNKEHFKCQDCGEKIMTQEYYINKDRLLCMVCNTKSKKFCSGCFKFIDGKSLNTLGKYYHKECFKCSICQNLIEQKHWAKNGYPVCQDCTEKCACGCNEPISGKFTSTAIGLKYNEGHFKCTKCSNSIASSEYAEKNGQVICINCLEKCACGCGKIVQGRYTQLGDGKKYNQGCFKCSKCANSIHTSEYAEKDGQVICINCLEKCGCGCGKPLQGKYTVLSNGTKMNQGCLKCSKCYQPITGTEYAERNDQPVCVDCIEKCACGCLAPIKGQYVQLQNGMRYNQGCLKCQVCLAPIQTQTYGEKNNKPTCLECLEKCSCGCGNIIKGNYTQLENGRKYNQGCFKCGECDDPILSKEYFVNDNKVICNMCNVKSQKICNGCFKPIEGDYIQALDKYYMRECFKCVTCSKIIETPEHGEKSGFPVCVPCIEKDLKQQQPSQSAQSTSFAPIKVDQLQIPGQKNNLRVSQRGSTVNPMKASDFFHSNQSTRKSQMMNSNMLGDNLKQIQDSKAPTLRKSQQIDHNTRKSMYGSKENPNLSASGVQARIAIIEEQIKHEKSVDAKSDNSDEN